MEIRHSLFSVLWVNNYHSSLFLDTLLVSVFPVAHVLQTGVFSLPFVIQFKKLNMFWRILYGGVFLTCFSIFTSNPFYFVRVTLALRNISNKKSFFIHSQKTIQNFRGSLFRNNSDEANSVIKCSHHFFI